MCPAICQLYVIKAATYICQLTARLSDDACLALVQAGTGLAEEQQVNAAVLAGDVRATKAACKHWWQVWRLAMAAYSPPAPLAPQAATEAPQPLPSTQETPAAETPTMIDPEAKCLIAQIDSAWATRGITSTQLASFWDTTCARFVTQQRDFLHLSELAVVLKETTAWIAKQPRKPAPEPADTVRQALDAHRATTRPGIPGEGA